MRILPLSLLAAAIGVPALLPATACADALEPCPYSHEDLAKALGADMKPGKPGARPGGHEVTCEYAGRDFASGNLHVLQTVLPAAKIAAAQKAGDKAQQRLEPIAGDADHAAWVVDPYAPDNVTLQYFRGNVRTEIRLLGGMGKVPELRTRVLSLRRVP